MHFDLFYELSVPEGRRTESETFHNTLKELKFAEKCGFRAAWLVEHHFMPQYSHSSAPDLLLAAASQATQRLRLGLAIVPLPYHHPVQVAERLATLDILSEGRLEFGFGRGFSPREYRCFNVEMTHSRSIAEESLAVIYQCLTTAKLHFQGQHFNFDDLTVLPRCIQTPHPPLWMAAVSPESFKLAGALGVGVLAGPFKPWFMLKHDIQSYIRNWLAPQSSPSSLPTALTRPQVGMTIGIYCLKDGKRARSVAEEGIVWFYRQLLQQTLPTLERLYVGYEYYRRYRHLHKLLSKITSLKTLELLGMVIVGDPSHCVKRLKALQCAGVTHVLCAIGAGITKPDQNLECMQVLKQEVFPQLNLGIHL